MGRFAASFRLIVAAHRSAVNKLPFWLRLLMRGVKEENL
jgi:hypothetical protein